MTAPRATNDNLLRPAPFHNHKQYASPLKGNKQAEKATRVAFPVLTLRGFYPIDKHDHCQDLQEEFVRPGRIALGLLAFLLFLGSPAYLVHAACDEGVPETIRELVQEEQSLRATEQAVQASKARLRAFETALLSRLSNPPPTYDRALARQLIALRRTEVEPKRQTLENLRAQHEEARRQWERGHQQLAPQLAEARSAYRAKMMTEEEFCHIRDTYNHALRLYLQGMKNYRRGLDLYARALDEYRNQFIGPYISGFANPRYWEELIDHLKQGNFLQDILVPMTVNAIRSLPPDTPPE